MGKTALEKLSSEDGQLFHLVIGHLLMLGLLICAAALTELVQQTQGPLSGLVYFLLNIVIFVVLVFLVFGKCDKAIDKLVDLAERHIETPRRLQSGYVWLRKKISAFESFFSALFIALIASAVAGGLIPGLGLEDMDDFARTSLTWLAIYGVFLALLIFASWLAGHFDRRPKGMS